VFALALNYVIAAVPRRLDGTAAEELLGQLQGELTQMTQLRDLILDLSTCDFVSSAGIRYLIVANDHFKKREGVVALCGATENVLQVLLISGLNRTFRMFRDTPTAMLELGHN
jgi:anti-anti-sigma factor